MRIKSFEQYVQDLLDHPPFQELHQHAGHHFKRSRFAHSYAVGKLSYRLARIFHANVTVAARAGLLHDWYYDRHPHFKRVTNPDMHHFRQSVETAGQYGESPEVLHAIRTHMWPWGRIIPRTREAWIVWVADNIIWVVDLWQSLKQSLRLGVHYLIYGT
jgi:uncharacterized protein